MDSEAIAAIVRMLRRTGISRPTSIQMQEASIMLGLPRLSEQDMRRIEEANGR